KRQVDRVGGGTHHLEAPVHAISRGADAVNRRCRAHRYASLDHHPARVAGLRVKRTRLATTTHTRLMMGETNREYAPSGAQNPPLSHVVPPSKTSTTAATPAAKSPFEISPARQSPNVPAMISIARGNE